MAAISHSKVTPITLALSIIVRVIGVNRVTMVIKVIGVIGIFAFIVLA